MKGRNMKKLNQGNLDVYLFIKDFIKENGYSPSYREIQENVNYKSLGTVREVVEKLIELKFLKAARDERGNLLARTIKVIDDDNTKSLIEELRKTISE